MTALKKYFWPFAIIIMAAALAILFHGQKAHAPENSSEISPISQNNNVSSNKEAPAESAANINSENNPVEIKLVGPRQNLPDGAPADYGFWSLAVPVPGVLSRSGQPTIKDFQWLHDNGWKSVIDLRIDGDHNEISDDAKIPGFNNLGFNYLKIQMVDGAAPTGQQAQDFLDFVAKKENQPAHVHCRGGIGRAGIMVAIYRYAVQGWPLDKIFAESKLFQGGIDDSQKKWIEKWAQSHAPGSYGK